MSEIPTFGLSDIPETWWVELNSIFVDQLDEINRPWPHEKGGHGVKRGRGRGNRNRARYWEAGELHRRTLDRMTPEDVEGYKRRHSLFEKLWGRHRYKDYHFAADDPRRYVNSGAWILKSDLDVIREGIIIEDSEMERAITGFRVGKFSNNVREVKVPRLPIVADEWWAWMMGFYFGAGNIYTYHRVGPNTRKEGWTSIYLKLRANDEVLPRLIEVATHTGSKAIIGAMSGPKFRGTKATGLKAGTRRYIVLGWPDYFVLRRFGLPTAFLELKDRRKLLMAASCYKPVIPPWIKENDRFMHSFIEAYMSTGRAQSVLGPGMNPNTERATPNMQVILTAMGMPEKHIKQLLTEIYNWFTKHGLTGHMSKATAYKVRNPNRVLYRIYYTSKDALNFILDNFTLYKSEVRARVYALLEAHKDQVLYEALRILRPPDNVILGLLLEQPLTETDINELLMMKPEGVKQSLQDLMDMGLVIPKEEHYIYYPEVFAERTAEKYEAQAEEYLKQMTVYLDNLLYQCSQCNHVYIKEATKCNYCEGKVNPVPRRNIVGRMGRKRMYDLYIAKSLRGEINE